MRKKLKFAMAEPLGTPANPLRVAIIGSGPSGFYAAAHLQSQDDLTVEIDMFDRLPTPYGLVRGGVAPDHQKIKSVTGQSIGEFVRTLRLKKAAQLMTQQDISLTDVMYSVGIQTQSYFTKAFKKEFGKTPSQFLKDLEK